MNTIEQIIIRRDGVSPDEARQCVSEARARVWDGESPEKILAHEFLLEPDYVNDLIGPKSFTAMDE
jgi:hypothetical protein